MKTYLFIVILMGSIGWMMWRERLRPSQALASIDAIVPAYNEELCISQTVRALLHNRYIRHVIVVDDGSTDCTAAILADLVTKTKRLTVIKQANAGKGAALNAGIAIASSPYVFLTDADTVVPPKSKGLGYLIAEIEQGADAVGGIPASNLKGAGLLPHIRATVKLPMIAAKRTFQQIAGGAPFLISGACGLFRTEVLREVPFSDRTKVEDLDLTWTLVGRGYRVRHCNRCIVYSQECNSLKSEWLRWRRWIIGYAVCMRLHRSLLLSRFGLLTILPIFLLAIGGFALYAALLSPALAKGGWIGLVGLFFPAAWLLVVAIIGSISAIHYRRPSLFILAPAALFYVLLANVIWIIHGLKGLLTGKEPSRDKPARYSNVVG